MIGLKTLILTVMITTVAAAAQPDVAIGQTEQHREAADIPPELLPTLEKELKNPFPECSEQRFKEDVGVEWFDLTVCDVMHGDYVTTKPLPFSMNRHKPAALLVEGAGGCAGGGNDNWEHLLYVRTGNGWRNIFVDVFQDSLIRRCTSTHGLPDLEVWHHASASEGDQVVYRFDGKVYKEAECIQQLYDTVSEKPYTAPCQIPSDFLAMFRHDLRHKKDLEKARSCLEKQGSPLKENVRIGWFYLKRPELALFVLGTHPCSGENDPVMFLYIRSGKNWRQILHTTGDSLRLCGEEEAVCPVPGGSPGRSNSTQGWPDLEVGLGQSPSGSARRIVGFQFDGDEYKATVCNDLIPTPMRPCPSGWKASEQ